MTDPTISQDAREDMDPASHDALCQALRSGNIDEANRLVEQHFAARFEAHLRTPAGEAGEMVEKGPGHE